MAAKLGRGMDNRRKLLIALGASALAAPFGSFAQQQGKIWRIGYLDYGSRQSMLNSGRYAALMQGLREFGYVEGKNSVLEARYAEGNADRLGELAAELVRQKADLIMTFGTAASQAAQRRTATIPIVVLATPDPVKDGFAVSLARPGGNITGMSNGVGDIVQKLVELSIVAVPKLKRIAVLANSATNSHASLLLQVQTAARKADKQVLPVSASTPDEIERGFANMVRERADALVIFSNPFLFQQRTQIAGLALKHRLPSIYATAGYAEAGGLMNYGADITDNYRRAGIFVDKILKGAKPGDVPFEQPTRYSFVINRKTANTLGIKLSNELLARADKVIE
jgi:putative ABC transport system substrate-binding protein